MSTFERTIKSITNRHIFQDLEPTLFMFVHRVPCCIQSLYCTICDTARKFDVLQPCAPGQNRWSERRLKVLAAHTSEFDAKDFSLERDHFSTTTTATKRPLPTFLPLTPTSQISQNASRVRNIDVRVLGKRGGSEKTERLKRNGIAELARGQYGLRRRTIHCTGHGC